MNPFVNYLFDSLAKYVLFINGAISVFVNVIAVRIILQRSSRYMVAYKWLLLHVTLASAFTDFFLCVLLAPIPIEKGVGTIMNGLLGRLLPSQGRLFCILIDISIGYMIWANLLCFVYRLYQLTTIKYQWLQKYLIAVLVVCGLLVVGTVILYIPALAPEHEIRQYARVHLNLTSDDCALWLILPRNFAANSRWGAFCLFYILVTYTAFGVITYTVNRILSRKGCMSKGCVAYHRMLMRSLLMQTFIPFLTVVFPVFVTGYAQKLKQNPDTQPYARLLSVPGLLLLSNYSVSHVAVMLFYTTPYQQFVAQTIRKYSCTRHTERSIKCPELEDGRESVNDVML